MLVAALDGNGNAIAVLMPGQESVTSRSATITAANQSQTAADENAARSGWVFQNQGTMDMVINCIGDSAAFDGGSLVVSPGETVGAPGKLPLTTQPINVLSAEVGAKFFMLEW